MRLKDPHWAGLAKSLTDLRELRKLERTEDGNIYYRPFKLRLIKGKGDFIFKQRQAMYALQRGGAKYHCDNDGNYVIDIFGMRLNIYGGDELHILQEVFLAGHYGLYITRPTVMIDIGMNVGITSLYFANMENIVAVHGYEPVSQTFMLAERNFKLNPTIVPKIHPHDYGLAAAAGEAEIHIDPSFRGSATLYDSPGHVRNEQVERIKLHAVVEEFRRLFAAYEGQNVRFALKLDAEGVEYEIIPALGAAGLLDKVHMVAMEWHYKGTDGLAPYFAQANFQMLIHALPHTPRLGMLYAFHG